jgi:hypothetical protein
MKKMNLDPETFIEGELRKILPEIDSQRERANRKRINKIIKRSCQRSKEI